MFSEKGGRKKYASVRQGTKISNVPYPPFPKPEGTDSVFPTAKGAHCPGCTGDAAANHVPTHSIAPIKSGNPDVLVLVRRLIIFELSCMGKA